MLFSIVRTWSDALSTDQKGAIAELAIAKAAIARRIGVYRPLSDGGRYDLIFDLGDRLQPRAVQVGAASSAT